MWDLVKGEDHGGVTWDTLRVIFLNLIGIRTPDREKASGSDESRVENEAPIEGEGE